MSCRTDGSLDRTNVHTCWNAHTAHQRRVASSRGRSPLHHLGAADLLSLQIRVMLVCPEAAPTAHESNDAVGVLHLYINLVHTMGGAVHLLPLLKQLVQRACCQLSRVVDHLWMDVRIGKV